MSVSSGLRVGAAIAVLVWIAALLVPLLVFSPLPTRIFFAVVLVLPVISALFIARLQVRSSLRRLRLALPPAPGDQGSTAAPRHSRLSVSTIRPVVAQACCPDKRGDLALHRRTSWPSDR